MLLVITMLLSFVPTISIDLSAETIDRTGWTKLTDTTITVDGKYYLDADITANIIVSSGVTATLDLNGHILTCGNSGSGIANYGTLTLTDADKSVTHFYHVNSDGLWVLDTEATIGTPYENLKVRPVVGDIIAIKGGAVTGGSKGTLINRDNNYGVDGTIAVGGGIYSAGDLTIDGAVICGNTIDNNPGGDYYGIGVFCGGENYNLKNGAILCGNSCTASGKNVKAGALFSDGTVSAQECSFSFNTTSFMGGAIVVWDDKSHSEHYANLTMNKCTLLGNSALYGGAANLFGNIDDNNNSVFKFENCTIDRNTAESDGGAINVTYGTLIVDGGSISHNALYVDGAYQSGGGAIYAEAILNLKNVTISDNSAVKGGAVFMLHSNLTAENVIFSKNKATGKIDYSNGGAICIKNPDSNHDVSKIKLTSCAILDNSADRSAGGMYLDCNCEAEITGGMISGNKAEFIGGGLYIGATLEAAGTITTIVGKATLTGVEISGNTAANGGGIGMDRSAQLLMNGCTVTGNSATGTDSNTGLGGGIFKPGVNQTAKQEWFEKIVLLDTQIVGNTAVQSGGGVYFKITEYEETECFAKGTLISMADGTTKKIEDVVEGDLLKTFDHETGEISSSKVYLAWQKKNTGNESSFKLHFEGGSSVQCIGGHDFLEKTTRKYQKLTAANAESFIGQYFYGEDGQWHKLLSVSIEDAGDKSYCIYTAKHQNAFAGGMLSAPDDVDYLLNIYELDENLKADGTQLAADIEKYGLTSFEYANEVSGGMTEEWYEAASAKYLFVAIGKGLVTEDYVKELYATTVEDYPTVSTKVSEVEGLKVVVAKMRQLDAPAEPNSNEAPKLADFDAEYIYIGTGTKVTGNTVGSEANNVYLDLSQQKPDKNGGWEDLESLIRVCSSAANINIGVTVSGTPTVGAPIHVTTAENPVDYSDYFFSDNPNYSVYSIGSGSQQQVVVGAEVAKIVETNVVYGTVQAAVNSAANGQTVKMIANSTEYVQIGTSTKTSQVVTIDLNGKTLRSIGTVEGMRNNAITNYATLTISDSSKDGSGIITGGTGSVKGKGSYGGGVYNSQGTLTITGGTITGNSAGFGGGVANIKGTFTMTGGCITGNTSTSMGGGGVANIDGGTFVMTSGIITGNTASKNGGGVYNENGTFIISGGIITANSSANNGGGVYNNGTMIVSGDAKIIGNSSAITGDGAENNVYLINSTSVIFVGSTGLNNSAKIGITTGETPVEGAPIPVVSNGISFIDNFTSDQNFVKITSSGFICLGILTKDNVTTNDLIITPPSDLTYDGTAKTYTVTAKDGSSGMGTITVKYKHGETAVSSAINVGTYIVYVDITEGDDYFAVTDLEVGSMAILPRSINITADDKLSYVGDDLVGLTYTYDSSAICVGDAITGSLSTDADKSMVGDYDIVMGTLAINDGNGGLNYTINFTKGTYSVSAIPCYTIEYGVQGNENTPVSANKVLQSGAMVKIDPNGGYYEGSTAIVEFAVSESSSIANPTRDSFVFRGWEVSSDALYELILTAIWDEDKISSSGNTPDGIPDKYQRTIYFYVVNGTFVSNGTTSSSTFVTLQKDGKWSVDGLTFVIVPTASQMTPNASYVNSGAWNPKLGALIMVTSSSNSVFTYTYDTKKTGIVEYDTIVSGKLSEKTSSAVEYDTVYRINPNEGMFEGSSAIVIRRIDGDVVISAPTRENYIFMGWKVLLEKGQPYLFTLRAVWELDVKSEIGSSADGIPDKYQRTVEFVVVNGTFTGSTAVKSSAFVTLMDGDKWSKTGSASIAVPTASEMTPNVAYVNSGAWDKSLGATLTVTASTEQTFTYTYDTKKTYPVEYAKPVEGKNAEADTIIAEYGDYISIDPNSGLYQGLDFEVSLYVICSTSISDPVKKDCVFRGWNVTSSGTYKYIFTAIWDEDKVSSSGNTPDGIPDKYQRTVEFVIENGHFTGSTAVKSCAFVTLMDGDKWSVEGSAAIALPTAAEMEPDDAYMTNGYWDGEVGPTVTVTATSAQNYVFIYTTLKVFTVEYSEPVENDNPKTTAKPVTYGSKVKVDPNGGLYEGSTAIVVYEITSSGAISAPVREGFVFRGWVSTTDAEYKIILTAIWDEDNLSAQGNTPDGIPDKYQRRIEFEVVNGTFKYGGSTGKSVFVTLMNNGKWSLDKGYEFVYITPDMDTTPNAAYVNSGAWNENINVMILVTSSSTAKYIYTYDTVKTFDIDAPGTEQDETAKYGDVVVIDPNGGLYEGSTAIVVIDPVIADVTIGTPARDGFIFAGWNLTTPVVQSGTTYVYKAMWDEDVVGEDGKSDGIPDKYQKVVTLSIVNGAWNDQGDTEDIVFVLTLTEGGKWSITGTAEINLPTTMKAFKGFEGGSWNEIISGILTGNDSMHLVYSFEEAHAPITSDRMFVYLFACLASVAGAVLTVARLRKKQDEE